MGCSFAGKGLGIEFLKHCERTRLLVHLIDGTSKDPIHDFEAINNELQLFNPELASKPQVRSSLCLSSVQLLVHIGLPYLGNSCFQHVTLHSCADPRTARALSRHPQIIAYNKMDVPDSSDYFDLVSEYLVSNGYPPPMPVSAATGRGVTDLGEHGGWLIHHAMHGGWSIHMHCTVEGRFIMHRTMRPPNPHMPTVPQRTACAR